MLVRVRGAKAIYFSQLTLGFTSNASFGESESAPEDDKLRSKTSFALWALNCLETKPQHPSILI
jgi:hypothetical protein